MTDIPATAQDIIVTIRDCCRSVQTVRTIRDMAIKSGRYTEQEIAKICDAAGVRMQALRGR